ncbi:Mur ligase family protein [Mucisphaera calidilacus]|uniref:Mur ligase family protein n=1 Tax=Mucisphaera calidilacus TaxID=2527982 RepID=UPI001F22A34A|nr:UDP-N-acetylmuramoyl-L-alanyl-D-glutamate--2,6-diaminopimelate ligase [Mucisphaera calidilacus]
MDRPLPDLFRGLPIHADPLGDAVHTADLTDDSRRVTPQHLFIHRRSDHPEDLRDALSRQPAALLVTPDNQKHVREPVPTFLADTIDQKLCGQLADRFFNHPAKHLTLAAVTGTNGKSTTALYLQHLLKADGIPTGLLGTIHNDLITDTLPAALTTPGSIEITRLLATIRDQGGHAAVYEASSHALHQQRTDHLHPAAAIFTNLTQDHLDYHKTMTAYAQAKARLFDNLTPHAHAILNADDPHAQRMAANTHATIHRTTTADTPDANTSATIHQRTLNHTTATLTGPWGSITTNLPILGDHNVANLLQALTAAAALNHLPDNLQQALHNLPPVPGRLERVLPPSATQHRPTSTHTPGGNPGADPGAYPGAIPKVFVDYAHTPDSLEHASQTLKALAPRRLLTLFGCGGDRDRAKRPLMTLAAARYADHITLTSDNPRSEDPLAIINDALTDIPAETRNRITTEPDRAAAIHHIITTAHPDDTILIAGKGHETYQEIQGSRHPFDDREHASNALADRAKP